MQPVNQEQLGQLASQQVTMPDTINNVNDAGNANTTAHNGFDWLDQWAAEYAPELITQFHKNPDGGRKASTECPLDPSHGRDVSVRQFPSGAIVAGCYHASCSLKTWHDYRAVKEAEYPANPATSPSNNAQPCSTNWQPPTPLERVVLPEPPALDILLIPDELRDNCEDIAYRLQAPIEYAVVCLIIMFATLIGHKLVIYAKRFDSWLVSPNIWGLVIGPPSAMKSPVIREVMSRLIKLDKRVFDNYLKEKSAYDADIAILDSDIKDLLNQQKKKSTDLTIPSKISAKRQELKDKKANPPLMQRLVLQDATIEKAQEILSETGAAALILWDEISTMFKLMNKANREGDRGFYLASWNGTDPSITDRIKRGTVIIDRLGLSLFGGIQPDVLMKFMSQAMDQFGNDGFMQRFQLILFPPFNKAGEWQYTDKTPDPISNQFLDEAIEILYDWTPEKDVNAALYRSDKAGFVGVQFDDDAQQMFKEWLTKLQRSLRDGSIDSNIEIEHYAKYSALMLKLALIFHVIKHVANRSIPAKVDLITTARAIAWTEYLALHAERLYAIGKNNDEEATIAALDLLEKIKDNKLKNGMTLSKITRKCWSRLNDPEKVAGGLELLKENGWLRLVETGGKGSKGGPITKVIEIHPHVSQYLKERHQYIIETKEMPTVERPWLERLQQLEDAPLLAARLLLTHVDDDDEDDYIYPEWLELIAASL